MQPIHDLIGREMPVDNVNRALRGFAQSLRMQQVGAVHVTCSDESEREAAESFHHWFADALLPEIKYSARTSFRTANLGSRYEWGAIRIAEDHYTTEEARDGVKLMVVKLNSHAGVIETSNQSHYGKLVRYGCESTCCGALNALLAGARHPAFDELATAFNYDDLPRLDLLRDAESVDPEVRNLVAAVINARIQARSAIVDIQDYEPKSPTVFVVLPCVTLNRKQRDTELVVGVYWADSREGTINAKYSGLGDDPRKYDIESHRGYMTFRDGQINKTREARDHRQEVVEQWRARRIEEPSTSDPRIGKFAEKSRKSTGEYTAKMAQESLKTLLWIAADISPIPLSIMLFAKGLVGVHRLYSVHCLARGSGNVDQARDIIEEVSDEITKIPADRVQQAIDTIVSHYHA